MYKQIVCILCVTFCSTFFLMACETDESEPVEEANFLLPVATGNAETDALAALNYYRELANLPQVSLASGLSEGCQAHTNYMFLHEETTHDEDPELEGYSEIGALAGVSANVASGQADMIEAVTTWMSGPYHRFPMLDPGLTLVGVGLSEGFACLDVLQGRQEVTAFAPIPYPAEGQQNVPRSFSGNEIPDPLINVPYHAPTGFILSLTFPSGTILGEDILATVYANREPQERATQLPNDPDDPNAGVMRNSLYIVPESQLLPNTTYRITINGTRNDAPFQFEWSFLTGS